MRFLVLAFLVAVLTSPVPALGTLTQPDGSVTALGEQSSGGARTLLFPPQAVPAASWILLPEGAVPSDVEAVSAQGRRVIAFPSVKIPGLRFALEVPARLLSLTLRGQFPLSLELRRAISPPTGARPWVVRSNNELRVDLPVWKVAEGWTPLLELTRPAASPWRAELSNGTSASFSFSGAVKRWDFAPAAWGLNPRSLVVTGADPRLSEVRLHAVDAGSPLPADAATLLAWPESRWRNASREWFSWAGTKVLVLVTADYRVQDAYLKRLAFFVEKAGFRGRVVSDEEMAALHGWNAHDYAAPDLARFFTQAAQEDFPLGRAERELRDRLVSSGILVEDGPGVWKAGQGALLGISAASAPALRRVLFVHEAFHGLYFTTPAFRDGVKRAWDGLSEAAREAFRSFLSLSRYDPTDEALMINEFQAYVLQRPAADWEGFFRNQVLGRQPNLTWQLEYQSAARGLSALVEELFGFPSGNVSTVTPF